MSENYNINYLHKDEDEDEREKAKLNYGISFSYSFKASSSSDALTKGASLFKKENPELNINNYDAVISARSFI